MFGTGSPLIVTGLTNGDAYHFFVQAENDVGWSERSALSNGCVPEGKPTAPLNVTATSSGACATINWLRPRYMPPVLFHYVVATSDFGFVNQRPLNDSATTALICNLVAGRNYSFVVMQHNHYGDSPLSALSNNVTISGTERVFLLGLIVIYAETEPSEPLAVLQPALVVNASSCLMISFTVSCRSGR